MSDSFESRVAAVQKEIVQQSHPKPKEPQGAAVIKVLAAALVVMVAAAWAINHPPGANTEADVEVILQQARHEVYDHYHHTGVMPDEILNPALRPYVAYTKLNEDEFELSAKLGNVERRH